MKKDGNIVVEPKEQADLLNTYYASVFTRSDTPAPKIEEGTGERLTEIEITEEDVYEVIEGLRADSAPGPDMINNRVLKETKDELKRPLTLLFRKSMAEARIPDDWREAHVTPIYKEKGKKSETGNYRPVSLTSSACKAMERLVKKGIEDFVERTDKMSDSQHGFRRGRSPQKKTWLNSWTQQLNGLMKANLSM